MFISSSWTSPPRLWHHCFHATKRLGGRLFCSFVGLLLQPDSGSKKNSHQFRSVTSKLRLLVFQSPEVLSSSTHPSLHIHPVFTVCDLFHRHTASSSGLPVLCERCSPASGCRVVGRGGPLITDVGSRIICPCQLLFKSLFD